MLQHRRAFIHETAPNWIRQRQSDHERPPIERRGHEHVILPQPVVINRSYAGLPVAHLELGQTEGFDHARDIAGAYGEPRHLEAKGRGPIRNPIENDAADRDARRKKVGSRDCQTNQYGDSNIHVTAPAEALDLMRLDLSSQARRTAETGENMARPAGS